MQTRFHDAPHLAHNELPRARCDGCGASTPVIDVADPKCAYCGRVVSLTADVQARSRERARALFDARSAGVADVRALQIRGMTRARVIATLMTLSSLSLVGWWLVIARDRGFVPSAWDVANLVLVLLGPATFFLIARHIQFDATLQGLAELSIARLEERSDEMGVTELALICSACGNRLTRAVVHGLTIVCDACHAPSLAPSVVVGASQARYYRRIQALRDTLDTDLARVPWVTLLVGGVYGLTSLSYVVLSSSSAGYATGLSCAYGENLALTIAGIVLLAGEENLWLRSIFAFMFVVPPGFAIAMMFLELSR